LLLADSLHVLHDDTALSVQVGTCTKRRADGCFQPRGQQQAPGICTAEHQ